MTYFITYTLLLGAFVSLFSPLPRAQSLSKQQQKKTKTANILTLINWPSYERDPSPKYERQDDREGDRGGDDVN